MKFIKAPDLYNYRVMSDIRTGRLRLQCGQYVRCGSRLSRFVRVIGSVVEIIHGVDLYDVNAKFKRRIHELKTAKEYIKSHNTGTSFTNKISYLTSPRVLASIKRSVRRSDNSKIHQQLHVTVRNDDTETVLDSKHAGFIMKACTTRWNLLNLIRGECYENI